MFIRRDPAVSNSNTTCGGFAGYSGANVHNIVCNGGVAIIGRYVTVKIGGANASLGLCEIIVTSQAVEPVSGIDVINKSCMFSLSQCCSPPSEVVLNPIGELPTRFKEHFCVV